MARDSGYYDVIIVGGGPAGSTAGYLLGNFGFQVLIIDQCNFPRQKLCGGVITSKTLKLLGRIFNETESSLRSKSILNFSANEVRVFYEDECIAEGISNMPFFFVDRETYDYFLLKKAKKAGVEIVEGEAVRTIDPFSKELLTSTGRTCRAKFIIGADGVNSIVRDELFLRGDGDVHRWSHDLAFGLEIAVDRSELGQALDYLLLFFGFVNWGYAWVFPNRDRLLVGLAGLRRKNEDSILDLFCNFLSFLNLDQERMSKITGHLIPQGNFLEKPVYENFALVGDAAGIVDPITGEGIFYAQRSAEFAAWAIHRSVHCGESFERSYLCSLRKYVYPGLRYAKISRPLIFGCANRSRLLMKSFLNIIGDMPTELVQGARTYQWLRQSGGIHEAV